MKTRMNRSKECKKSVVDRVDKLHIGFEAVMNRGIAARQSTFDAFVRMTGGRPTVPFNIDGADDTSIEELRLFKDMSQKYSRTVAPGKEDASAVPW